MPTNTTRFARSLLSASALASALMLAACGQGSGDAQHGGGPGGAPEVSVITLAPQTVTLTSELSGRTTAFLLADVRPQVSGIVKARLFTEGGDVKAGQTLYQIDPAPYEAALASARATLAKAEANVQTLKLKAGRYDELAGIDAVSKQDRDDTQASLKQAMADVEAGKAAVRTAQINLDYTRISAPISGRIGRSAVTPGALLTANQETSLATVQQLDPIYVDVTQTSAELLQLRDELAAGTLQGVKNGQAKVKLLLENGSTYPLEGMLQFSEVSVDQGTGSVTLRAVFPNPQRRLLPGMYVRAVVDRGTSSKAILAPQAAVSRDAKGHATAMVVDKSGKVQARALTTSRMVGDSWLVTSGLAAGDKLVVDGLQSIQPGATVKPVPAKTAAPAASAASAQN